MSRLLLAWALLGGCGVAREAATPALTRKEATWVPGADVPGWEDFPCSEPEGGNVVHADLPEVWGMAGVLYGNGYGGGSNGDFAFRLQWTSHDCAHFGCEDDPYGPPTTGAPFTYVQLNFYGDDLEGLTQGESGIDLYSAGSWHPYGQFILGGFADPPDYIRGWTEESRLCLSRVRPDEVRGQLVLVGGTTSPFATEVYSHGVMVLPFDMLFPAHAGTDLDVDHDGDPPGGHFPQFFYSGITYDDAWPWDDITDEAVRTALHDAYTPWNDP